MRRILILITAAILTLALTACGGGGGGGPTTFTTQLLSDPVYDGDIAFDSTTSTYTVRQTNTQSIFAGVDPLTLLEYRAFLDFPLSGTGGVPGNAVISSAILDFVINSISPYPLGGTIPIRIDLVSFQPPTLTGTDFDRTVQPALATAVLSPPISNSDFGGHVTVDVTSLMTVAQNLGLVDFQIRILEDLSATSPGLIEINDTTGANAAVLAPLLQVTYY